MVVHVSFSAAASPALLCVCAFHSFFGTIPHTPFLVSHQSFIQAARKKDERERESQSFFLGTNHVHYFL